MAGSSSFEIGKSVLTSIVAGVVFP